MRIDAAVREATDILKKAGVEDARRDAHILLVHLMDGDREILFRAPETTLSEDIQNQYQNLISRRSKREPVSHIIGLREFWSREFFVNSDVLDPRPDTETLVEAVMHWQDQGASPARILDLGTGSGCLLLTLLCEIKTATGLGVDISNAALTVAQQNAQKHDLLNRASFQKSRWFDTVEGRFNLIVSNPPYIETVDIQALQPEVRDFEPHLALDGGMDGLICYREITEQSPNYLAPGGRLVFEVGIGQAEDVQILMQNAGFEEIEFHNDLASVARCVSGKIKS
jgi:release factor glutamine methyltransferase